MAVILVCVLLLVAALAHVVHALSGKTWVGRAATGAMVVAWFLLLATLVLRGLIAGHWPLSNYYEFTLCFIWIIITIYLLLESYWRERRAGTFVLAVILILATRALLTPADEQAIGPLPPVLRSVWLQAHVLTVMVGYGAFGVAAGLGIMRLVYPVTKNGLRDSTGIEWLPPVEEAENMMGRVISLGFPWLTLGILAGAVWAQRAWGRYWGWDPKETWALITWLWYLLILYLRSSRGWRGRRLAWLAIIGFGLVLFTFVGVPRLARALQLDTLHGY